MGQTSAQTEIRPESAALARAVSRGTNQGMMRDYNERLVLSLIRQAGPMPKAAIARATGLSAQTVSVIMRALEEDGFLEKGAPLRGKVGQPSVPMGLRRGGAYFLGLKVGRRGSELVMSDFLGDVLFYRREPHRLPAPEDVLGFAAQAIADALAELPEAERLRVAGLGVALPFRLWDWAGATAADAAALEGWRERDIAEALGQQTGLPVYLCNDASAACGAELVFGTAAKPRDFLYFYIGSFVGGGLVLDNALYTGKSGNAAALGSLPVTSADGAACQLVDVASLATLEAALAKAGGDATPIWERAEAWDVLPDVLEGWLAAAADALAQAIAAAGCVIDFDTVLLDGSMPEALRAALVERTGAALLRRGLPGVASPALHAGSIGYGAKVMGAASLPLADRFLVERDAFLRSEA